MISTDQVARIAELARIELTRDELAAMQHQLNGILAMVDAMQAVDTSSVEPMSHPQAMMQRLRDDAPSEPDRRAEYQAIAPATEDGLYLVPKVIE
jgi:aspartyl-tRNA(Asn)/glutamyl-tRNA(Gln) amidotransferase subunit C